jgi:GNAT superfamily N-acetyltransferase
MTCLIRLARQSEIEQIRDLERASAQRFIGMMDALAADEPTLAVVLSVRLQAGGLLVATADKALAGFVMVRPVEDSLYVEQIDVLPRFAGRRIGAALLDAVAQRALAAGLARLTLSTFRDIPWNAPWYRRLGFIDLADIDLTPGLLEIRAEHIERGLDESQRVFMAREL